MTQDFWKTFTLNTSNIDRYFVGADSMAKRLSELANTVNISSFPPYNIKKVEDNKYVIEMAVAGFAETDIELTLEENKLLIKSKVTQPEQDATTTDTYLFKGIADRAFSRYFTLADNVEIQNAQLMNGMLKVWLEHVIPESKKPRKIEIETSSASAKKGSK
jgi:molecular chaperone IbpA